MVTESEIKKLAKLARLNPSEEELAVLTREMADILAFADTINRNVGEAEAGSAHPRMIEWEALRPDVPAESWPTAEILQNVDGGVDGFYAVQRSKLK